MTKRAVMAIGIATMALGACNTSATNDSVTIEFNGQKARDLGNQAKNVASDVANGASNLAKNVGNDLRPVGNAVANGARTAYNEVRQDLSAEGNQQ